MTHPRPHIRKGLTGAIREQLFRDLTRAGDITVIIAPDEPLPRLRIKVKQAIRAEAPMIAEMRTIGGQLHVRRTDITAPDTLPGMAPVAPSMADTLHSLRPWADDPLHDIKSSAIDTAIRAVAS